MTTKATPLPISAVTCIWRFHLMPARAVETPRAAAPVNFDLDADGLKVSWIDADLHLAAVIND
jgi:hypothetical protein